MWALHQASEISFVGSMLTLVVHKLAVSALEIVPKPVCAGDSDRGLAYIYMFIDTIS